MNNPVGIIDYGMGNLGSVSKTLKRIGVHSIQSSKPKELRNCARLILPGVGHFAKAVENLKKSRLWEYLHEDVIENKKPVLGICLGMQLMASHSEEGGSEGLAWLDANVVRFNVPDTLRYKVPHTGWNHITIDKETNLFSGVDLEQGFYFVHAYHMICNDKTDILNTTTYGYPFTSAVQRGNVFGVQYHPEKSHSAGKKLIKNFVEL